MVKRRNHVLPLLALAGAGHSFVQLVPLGRLQIRALNLAAGIAALPDVSAAEDGDGGVNIGYVGAAAALAGAFGFVGWVFSREPAKTESGSFKAISLATRDDFLPPGQRSTIAAGEAEIERRLAEREQKRQEILGTIDEQPKYLVYYEEEVQREMEDEMIQEMLDARKKEASEPQSSQSKDTQAA